MNTSLKEEIQRELSGKKIEFQMKSYSDPTRSQINKIFLDGEDLVDYILSLLTQHEQAVREEIYQQQKQCRDAQLFSHRNGLCLCYDVSRLPSLLTQHEQAVRVEMKKELDDLERKTERGMYWVRLDRVIQILNSLSKDTNITSKEK